MTIEDKQRFDRIFGPWLLVLLRPLVHHEADGDELPFWKTVNGAPHLIVPYSLTNNDGKYAGAVGTSEAWFSFIRDALDMLYREGARAPKMMSVGLHMRLIGHPARAAGLERLLDYIQKHDGVWVTKRVDIARHVYRGARR